jgi:hypothetical protein
MAGKDDYCPCCLRWLPITVRAQRFCGDCEWHATWCVEMASQRTRWDAFAERWRVVAAIPAVWVARD